MAWRPSNAQEAVMFRPLTDQEEKDFRQFAVENDPPRLDLYETYHPVCREEWQKRGINP